MSAVRPQVLPPLVLVLRVSRSRFWLYLGGSYALGAAAGATDPGDLLSWRFWVCLVYFLLPANVLLYGVNDLADKYCDQVNPRKQGTEHALQRSEERVVRDGVMLSLLLSLPVFLVIESHAGRAMLGGFLALAVLYSVPPVRLKARPLLDAASNSLYAMPLILGFQQFAQRPPSAEVIAIAVFWTSAMHTYSAALDIDADRQSGIRTTASVLGYRGALALCAVLWGAVALLMVHHRLLYPWSVAALCYPLTPVALLLRPQRAGLAVYRLFPALNALAGMVAFFVVGLRL